MDYEYAYLPGDKPTSIQEAVDILGRVREHIGAGADHYEAIAKVCSIFEKHVEALKAQDQANYWLQAVKRVEVMHHDRNGTWCGLCGDGIGPAYGEFQHDPECPWLKALYA